MNKLDTLLPIVKTKCEEFISACKAQGIDICVVAGYRSIEQQNAIYAQGRTTAGNIVSNAKGGQSFHNWKCAMDFAPQVNGAINWNDIDSFKRCGAIAKSIGFEWGGDFPNLQDWGHLQYTLGYPITDFQNGNVDYRRFGIEVAKPKIDTPVLSILDGKKTYIGIIITAVMGVLQATGHSNWASTQQISDIVNMTVTLFGAIFAIYGRATTKGNASL